MVESAVMGRMRQNRSIDVASIFGTCGKKRYPHQRAAEEAMQIQLQYASERGEALDLRVYKCPKSYCGGWHLTNASPL
jgi:hypothetical protein